MFVNLPCEGVGGITFGVFSPVMGSTKCSEWLTCLMLWDPWLGDCVVPVYMQPIHCCVQKYYHSGGAAACMTGRRVGASRLKTSLMIPSARVWGASHIIPNSHWGLLGVVHSKQRSCSRGGSVTRGQKKCGLCCTCDALYPWVCDQTGICTLMPCPPSIRWVSWFMSLHAAALVPEIFYIPVLQSCLWPGPPLQHLSLGTHCITSAWKGATFYFMWIGSMHSNSNPRPDLQCWSAAQLWVPKVLLCLQRNFCKNNIIDLFFQF